MSEALAGVVLAAGAGTRLRPLTRLRPKPLCPVGNVPLVDLAIERVRTVVADVAVNLHHDRGAMEEHLGRGTVHLSVEEERALGTAGALGHLRGWLDGRGAVVVNADAWCPGPLTPLLEGWDGTSVRLLIAGADRLGPRSSIAGALMPPSEIARLTPEPSGLYEASWRRADEEGRLQVVRHDGAFVDCGTPRQYLLANLLSSGGESVVAEDATVAGEIDRCVVWPGATVWPGESLVSSIRARDDGGGAMTVLVRPPAAL